VDTIIRGPSEAEEIGWVGAIEPVEISAVPTPVDLGRLVAELHDRHPDATQERISILVEQAYAEHWMSRVQAYRMILVERSVRRLLAGGLGAR